MQTSSTSWVFNLILGTEPRQRLRISRSLMEANVFVACIGLQIYAAWVGFMDAGDVWRLSSAIMVNVVFWYALMRAGYNLRFADPTMTLPQILAVVTIVVAGYASTGPVHGSTMLLLALVQVFGIFNMKPRGSRVSAAYTVLLMGLTILYKMRTDPVHYPPHLELAHFGLVATIVPTISSLTAQLSGLRSKLQAQKDELANALVRIQILATRDELTGLLNRRHMIEVITQHCNRLGRSGHHRFCLALIDIDHFKRINDTHGHGMGDEVLRGFADAIQKSLRDTDVLARWGGEEFLLLLNDTKAELANLTLERTRAALSAATLIAGLPELKPTFSAGLTVYHDAEALDVCIERADRALYKAKNEGRNRTVISDAPQEAVTAPTPPRETAAPAQDVGRPPQSTPALQS